MLSAQANDRSVNLATAKLFPVANTPQALLELGEAGLIPYIRTIGLYRTKAKNIIDAMSAAARSSTAARFPPTTPALVKLAGVGRKTANVVLNVAFGQPTIAVDTHVFRVANRTGLAPGKTPEEVERKLLKFTPKEFLHDAHHWLILHGRYVCLARKPKCPECVIADLCEYRSKTPRHAKPGARGDARSAGAARSMLDDEHRGLGGVIRGEVVDVLRATRRRQTPP